MLTSADLVTLDEASVIIETDASALRRSATKPPDHEDWGEELAMRAEYNRMMSVAAKLEDLSSRARKVVAS